MFGSLIEYWIHRAFHIKQSHLIKKIFPKLGLGHARHHKNGTAQGVLLEFRNYILGTSPVFIPAFIISLEVGLAWTFGVVTYAAFAAFAHQLQHEIPIKCAWMNLPVHYVHHKYNQRDFNYGIGVDWWDRLFGTYKEMDWVDESELNQAEEHMFAVKWL